MRSLYFLKVYWGSRLSEIYTVRHSFAFCYSTAHEKVAWVRTAVLARDNYRLGRTNILCGRTSIVWYWELAWHTYFVFDREDFWTFFSHIFTCFALSRFTTQSSFFESAWCLKRNVCFQNKKNMCELKKTEKLKKFENWKTEKVS